MDNSKKAADREEFEAALRARPWSPANDSSKGDGDDVLKDDPAFRESQQRSGEFNSRVHEALNTIPVPTDLREKILAGPKIVQVPFWPTPRAIALAAALALMATGLLFWTTAQFEDRGFSGFRDRMVGFALREYRMDIHTNDIAAVEKFLAQKGTPSDLTLPPTLARTAVKGGASLSWQGKPVSMVCFDALNTTLFMFVIEQGSINAGPTQQDLGDKGVSVTSWTTGNKVYLVAAKVPLAQLQQIIPQPEVEQLSRTI